MHSMTTFRAWLATAMLLALINGCSKSQDDSASTTPQGSEVAQLPNNQDTTSAESQQEDPLVGTWDWGWGDVEQGQEPSYQNKITLNADGSALSEIGSMAGKWERSGDIVTLRWANGATDSVTISEDGKMLDGKSVTGTPVRGRKT